MPNRILKESICTSRTIDLLTADEEVCFYRLMTQCDDYGRFFGSAGVVLGKCFSRKLERGTITVQHVEGWLRRLADPEVDLIRFYEVDGERYLHMPKWKEHQPVRAKASKFPEPPAREIICKQTQEDASNGMQMSPYSYSNSNANASTSSEQVDDGKASALNFLNSRCLNWQARIDDYRTLLAFAEVVSWPVVERAARITIADNKTLAYCLAILRRWEQAGVKSLADAETEEANFRARRKPQQPRAAPPPQPVNRQVGAYNPEDILDEE